MTARGPELRAKAAGLGSLPGEMEKNCGFLPDSYSNPHPTPCRANNLRAGKGAEGLEGPCW